MKFLNIFKFFDKKNKYYFYYFLIFNILTFLLEFLSLASVPIFISAMITPEYVLEKISTYNFIYLPKELDNTKIFIYASYFVLISFLLKNIFLISLTYFQDKYLKELNKKISKKIFDFYINGPFSIHLDSNPSALARNISYEIQNSTSYLYQIFMLTRDVLTLTVVFILLSVVNFKITFGIIILLILVLFIYIKKTKPVIKRLANFNQATRKLINQIIFEAFGAIKDIKVLNKQSSVSNFFNSKVSQYEDNYFKFKLISKMPKFILELFAITVIVSIGLIFSSSVENLEKILPTLSVIAISLLRFIPAFNSLNANYNYLRLYDVSINLIIKELNKVHTFKNTNNNQVNKNISIKKNFIEINNLTFGFNEGQNIFENLNLKISKGEKICIIGPTGSGKTTLFHLILGLIYPKEGFITHNGNSIMDDLESWYKKIGYISQNIYIIDNSIKNNITLNYNDEAINERLLNESISISQLKDKIKDSPFALETKVGMDGLKLSGGEKQRIAIARAIYRKPEIFLMDEFTSAIDEGTEEKIFNELIKNFPNKTLIMIAHKKSIVDKCDSVWKIQDKGIVRIK